MIDLTALLFEENAGSIEDDQKEVVCRIFGLPNNNMFAPKINAAQWTEVRRNRIIISQVPFEQKSEWMPAKDNCPWDEGWAPHWNGGEVGPLPELGAHPRHKIHTYG